jgi:hypothetical protein
VYLRFIDDNNIARIFAFIATVSIALLTAFNLGGKSNDTRNVCSLLSTQIMRFNKGFCSPEDLIRTYEQAERLIGDVLYRGMSYDEERPILLRNTNILSNANQANNKNDTADDDDSSYTSKA